MASTILLAFLLIVGAVWLALMTYHGLAGARSRRRTAWELDRIAWRRWIAGS